MTGRPKIQHWVPRFYLKYFATEETKGTANPKVWVINKDQNPSAPELAATKRICGKRYLYTPEEKDGNRDWSFEDYLSRLENAAADYWDQFATGQLELSEPEIRNQIAEFLAVLHLRNKFVFDLYKGIMEKRDALFGGPKPTGRKLHLEPHEKLPDPTHPGRHFVQSTRNSIPKITKAFASYRWKLLQCNEDVLSTSDVPVTFVNSTHRRSGPGSKNAKAVFPVTPKTLLYIENRDSGTLTTYAHVEAQLLKRVNKIVFHLAERFVILGVSPNMDAPSGLG